MRGQMSIIPIFIIAMILTALLIHLNSGISRGIYEIRLNHIKYITKFAQVMWPSNAPDGGFEFAINFVCNTSKQIKSIAPYDINITNEYIKIGDRRERIQSECEISNAYISEGEPFVIKKDENGMVVISIDR